MRKIGKYEVLGELGHGAMGVVYRARDPIINRLVALKTITSGLAEDPNLLQRFYREAQSAGGLQHPNIVTIYDMGDEHNLPYIAMELIDGESLDQTIAHRGNLPIALKLTYALQACRAFDYAHKRGIIHRDIKPGNVMVNKESIAKVVDFGIARVLDTSKTQTGMLIGTFAYMSPEQYHGEHADERSDIWSFGVLLYELLSYQKPFTGHNPASLMHCICQDEPRPLRELVPECPEPLDAIIWKILRKSPQDRWQSMEDLLLELEAVSKELQSRSIAELVDRSRRLVEEGDFTQARELLREALKVDAANAQAKNLLERVNAEIKRKLIRPKAQQHIERGCALLEEGRIQEAQAEVESALQLDPSFESAQELQKRVQQERDRAQVIAEWLQASRQRIAEGMPDEAESMLAKVLGLDPSNKLAKALQEQVRSEKAERQRRLRLLEKMQEARGLWTQQKYDTSIDILTALEKEFPEEEEVQRLLETVREDQAEQYRQDSLESVRNCLAAGNYASCRATLLELQKRFPNDDEISRLVEEVQLDEAKQRRTQGLVEARSLLAGGRYDESIRLLNSLQSEFPEDQDIPRLLARVREEETEEQRQKAIANARGLLASRRYEECNSLLAELQKEFAHDQEIEELLELVRQGQIEERKAQKMAEARSLLASGRFQDSIAALTSLQREFPEDQEVVRLLTKAREEQAEQQRQQAIGEVRSMLAARRYEDCNELLAKLRKQFPKDKEITELLEAVRQGETEQRKLKSLAEARNLLAARQYESSIARLTELAKEFADEQEITALLKAAQEARAEAERQQGVTEVRSLLAAQRYDECNARLAKLRKQFPSDREISDLTDAVQLGLAEQRKLKALGEARGLLAARKYEQSIAFLTALDKEFPAEDEILRLLATAHEGQAEQRKLKTLAEARTLLAAKRYEESIASLTPLQQEFPNDPEIPRLLTSVRREQAEHQKQQKLAEVRALVASQRVKDALQVIEGLLTTFPKDTAIEKLRTSVEREREKQSRDELLQRGLENIRKNISEKKYSEAVSRAESLLIDFPGNTDLLRLVDFAQSQQLQIENEARLRSAINEAKSYSQANRFAEAVRAAKTGLEAFPKNPELLYLREQAEAQQKRQRTRGLIEQAVREIRYKINRQDFSDAIDLAKRTLATAGPDTELTQLLNSAVVEFQTREKKREEEKKLQEIRGLMDSGNFDGAAETLCDAVTTDTLDELDPRVSRISEEIASRKTALKTPTSSPVPSTPANLSKEYAWLGATPEVEEPPPEQVTPPAPASKSSVAQPVVPAKPTVSSPPSEPAPPAEAAAPPTAEVSPQPETVPRKATPEITKEPSGPAVPAQSSVAVSRKEAVTFPKPLPGLSKNFRTAAAAILAVGLVAVAIGLGVHFNSSKRLAPRPVEPTTRTVPTALPPEKSAEEIQQLTAIRDADKLIASGDLSGALLALQQGEKVNGPLAGQIKGREATVRESLADQALARLRQDEAQVWQRASAEVDRLEFDAAKRDLRKILAYGNGGVRKEDARKYLDEIIPARQKEEELFRQAKRYSGASDAQSLQMASELLGRVVALNGPRRTEASDLQRDIETKLAIRHQEIAKQQQIAALEAQARENLRRGDFPAARDKAGQIRQLGGDVVALSQEIDQAQAKQARLAEQENEFQQARQTYNALNSNDKAGLEKSRSDFQTIARESGTHVADAQKYLAEIGRRLDALNTPPPQPKVQPEMNTPAATDEPAIRAVVQRFFQAFTERNIQGMKTVWPNIPKKKYDGYRSSFEQASAIAVHLSAENVRISQDGLTASVSIQTQQEYTPKGRNQTTLNSAPSWTFSLAKINNNWVITDVQ